MASAGDVDLSADARRYRMSARASAHELQATLHELDRPVADRQAAALGSSARCFGRCTCSSTSSSSPGASLPTPSPSAPSRSGSSPTARRGAVAAASQLAPVARGPIEDHVVVRELTHRIADVSERVRERMNRLGDARSRLAGRPDRGRARAREAAVDAARPARGARLMAISRGFRGRRRDEPIRRACRPASTSPATSRCSRPGRRRTRRSPSGTSRSAAAVDEARLVDLGGVPGAAERDDHGRHPLRHQVVEARHDLDAASRSTRCSTASRRAPSTCSRSATAATRRTCRSRTSPAARRGSPTSTTASRSSPSTAARRGCSCRTSTSGRAPSGCAASSCATTTSPGFWEGYGYHNYGDPWHEQRYCGD